MKIAYCLSEKDPDSILDERFGRCSWFLLTDESGTVTDIIENTEKDNTNGAGTGAMQLISDHDADTLIAPRLGPTAIQAMTALGIKGWHQGDCRNAQEALEKFKNNLLEPMSSPQAKGLHRV